MGRGVPDERLVCVDSVGLFSSAALLVVASMPPRLRSTFGAPPCMPEKHHVFTLSNPERGKRTRTGSTAGYLP